MTDDVIDARQRSYPKYDHRIPHDFAVRRVRADYANVFDALCPSDVLGLLRGAAVFRDASNDHWSGLFCHSATRSRLFLGNPFPRPASRQMRQIFYGSLSYLMVGGRLIPIPRQYSSLARLAMTVVSEDLPSSVFADADTLGRVAVLAERLHAGAVSDCRVHSSCVSSDRHQLKHYALGLRTTVSMVGASPKNDLRPTKSASRNFTGKVSIQVIR